MRTPRVRLVGALIVLHLISAVTAALVSRSTSTEVAVGTGFLADVAARTEQAELFRFEGLISISGQGVDLDAIPLLRGEQAGERGRFVVDLAAVAEQAGAPAAGVAMEMVSDGQVMFIRTPGLTAPGAGAVLPPAFAPLVELGDRWGRVDLAAARSVAPEDVVGVLDNQVLDLDSTLELLRASQEPREVGSGEVRGTEVTRYAATVAVADLGPTNEAMMPAGADPEVVRQALESAEVDVEFAVDDDNIIRRYAVLMDSDYFESVGEAIGAPPGLLSGVSMTIAFEIFDVGDASIVIELPAVADPVDLTGWAVEFGSTD